MASKETSSYWKGANLMPIINGSKVMQAVLYTGTGATQTIAVGFQPDLVWVKSRSAATSHKLTDSVRGATKALISNSTGAETTDTNGITAFTSNGFTLGSDSVYNTNGATYVAWCWQAGQGSTSSNTNGTITSTVSVNASAGFSVVTYTGTGTNGATVGHGLGVTPSMMVFKRRNTTSDWATYHSSIGNTGVVFLNLTSATTTTANAWNNTSPTSSVFSLGVGTDVNGSGSTYVAYCWTPIAGFSAFGSYTGNGSTDGPFVYTGFRPKFVMVKCSSSDLSGGAHWVIEDSSRSTYNAADAILYANLSNAEGSGEPVDFLSNGFKIRNTVARWNSSGATFIYMAFAESPFRNSLAR
jgi:hypothetical protein